MRPDDDSRIVRARPSQTFTARSLGGSLLLHALVIFAMAAGFAPSQRAVEKENTHPPLRVTLMMGSEPVALPVAKGSPKPIKKASTEVSSSSAAVANLPLPRPEIEQSGELAEPLADEPPIALIPLAKSRHSLLSPLSPIPSSPRRESASQPADVNEEIVEVVPEVNAEMSEAAVKPPRANPSRSSQQGQWHVDPLALYQQEIAHRVQHYMRGTQAAAVCRLRVHLARDGGVREQHILSGDNTACAEAQRALLRAGRLPLPKDPALYKYLSTLVLTVRTTG